VEALRDQYGFNLLSPLLAHYRCMEGYYSMQEREFVESVLCDDSWNPGGLGVEVDEIPNEYRGAWNTPWFRIRFTKALPGVDLVIGKRKRVWNIEVRNLTRERIGQLARVFDAAKVTDTMGSDATSWYVHAWTKEQVLERVGMIMGVLLPATRSVAPTMGEGATPGGGQAHAAGPDQNSK
jgi:hypothetical protein